MYFSRPTAEEACPLLSREKHSGGCAITQLFKSIQPNGWRNHLQRYNECLTHPRRAIPFNKNGLPCSLWHQSIYTCLRMIVAGSTLAALIQLSVSVGQQGVLTNAWMHAGGTSGSRYLCRRAFIFSLVHIAYCSSSINQRDCANTMLRDIQFLCCVHPGRTAE